MLALHQVTATTARGESQYVLVFIMTEGSVYLVEEQSSRYLFYVGGKGDFLVKDDSKILHSST